MSIVPRPRTMLLDKIIYYKKKEVAEARKMISLQVLRQKINRLDSTRSFRRSLSRGRDVGIIAEIKRHSPVKGLLCEDFNPVKLADAYEQGGAGALSVLTDRRFFKGSSEYLPLVKETVSLPVLRKDFIINSYQVYESRAYGADAVLLIAGILKGPSLKELLHLAHSLDMEALVEVGDGRDLEIALEAGAALIGVNNRDLKTFQVSIARTLQLAPDIPGDIFLVSESGISTREDVLALKEAGVKAVLVGEALVRSKDPRGKLQMLLGRSEKKESDPECG